MLFYFKWQYMNWEDESTSETHSSSTNDNLSFKILKNAMHYDIFLMLIKSQESAIRIKYRLVIKADMGRFRHPNTIIFSKEGEAEFRGNLCEDKIGRISIDHIKIKILGDITELTDEPKSPILVTPQNCSLGDDFSSLLKNCKFSDVELVSRDKRRFRAHACILAARSLIFFRMFGYGTVLKKSNVIEIDDVDGEILQLLLEYIYAGRFYEKETTKMEQLLIAANKYAIDQLKACCEEALVKQLSVESVCDVLVLADDQYAKSLKEKAVEFILQHGEEMLQSPKFLEIEASRPKLAIEVLRHKCD